MIEKKINSPTISLMLLSLAFIGFLQAQTVKIITKTGSGVYLLPSNVETLTIECWGGGGAGGYCLATGSGYSPKVIAGGGAGGSYAATTIIKPAAGTYNYMVGAGGTANIRNGSLADSVLNGESTSFGNNIVVAIGGIGGESKVVANAAETIGVGGAKATTGNIGTVWWYGGAGGTGQKSDNSYFSGAGGASAGTASNGGDALVATAGSAGKNGGAVGATGLSETNNGKNGIEPGAGGSGALLYSDKNIAGKQYKNGGNGANGKIIMSYTCANYVPLKSFSISNASAIILNGAKLQLTPEFTPIDASNKNVTYISSNTATAKISNTGLISAEGPGKSTITAIADDGDFTNTIQVNVYTNTLTIANVFGNNMVLQQDIHAPIWGWGPPNENVSIKLDKYPPVVIKADATGKWMAKVPTPKATKGSIQPKHTLTFIGKNNSVTFTNILIGDVYFCSGQSNMAFNMHAGPGSNLGVLNYKSEIAAAVYPNLRLHKTGYIRNLTPIDRVNGEWDECNPTTVKEFSGVAYYFARELYLNENVNIPIGVIVSAVGGSSVQSWISREALAVDAVLKANYLDVQDSVKSLDHQTASTILYNGMIAPIHPFAIKGFLWYQGEANENSSSHYTLLQSAMIKDWRTRWGQGNLPFLYVQMPAHALRSPFLRDQQTNTLLVENTGMAVTLDVGDSTDIHPRDKYSVGKRLSKIALAKIYNQDVVYTGPTLKSKAVEGNKIRIKYHPASVGSGLAIRWNQTSLNEFMIAGKDGVFYQAVAEISGNDVLVSSPKVPSPQKVKFAYTNNSMPNLMNKDSLTACPFNSETWNYDLDIK